MRRGAGSDDAVRAGAVARLRARRGELIETIFRKVQEGAFAGAGDDDAEYLAGLRAAFAAAVEIGLQGIERGAERAGPIPAAAVEQARRAACTGVSLDTVLRRYVAAAVARAGVLGGRPRRARRPARGLACAGFGARPPAGRGHGRVRR